MVSNRTYRKGLPFDVAVAELERCKGAQFDEMVVNAFMRLVDSMGREEFINTYCSHTDDGE
jgi:HD-GYP domain-containing protein (c-di-GMP phosphodiesterase class II)